MKVSASHRGVLSRVLGIVHCGGIAFPEVLEHFLATALPGVVVVQNLKPGLGRARIRRELVLGHDAFEVLAADGFEELDATVLDVICE